MNRHAYLILHIDTRTRPPTVAHAQIASAPPSGITSYSAHVQYASLMETEGESYADARASLLQAIELNEHRHWLKKFLTEDFRQ